MKFIMTIFIAVAILIGSAVADLDCYNQCDTKHDACLATCNGARDKCLKDCAYAFSDCNKKCG